MKQSRANTLEKVWRDAKAAATEYVGKQVRYRELDEPRFLERHADDMAYAIVERLRNNWTVSEKPRGKRMVP